MAARFHRGGRLFTFGTGGAATDAQHVAVEFVHPVIVGKRALPALSLTGDVATLTGVGASTGFDEIFAHQLRCFGGPGDIALGISPDGRCGSVRRGLDSARDLGMLTVALAGGDGEALAGAAGHLVTVPSADPRVVKEVHVTAYHMLWELVHVFLEHPDVLSEEVVT
ncbi:SIS domain-containing protein [Actinomadura sp. 7K507]|nr:SIS domain-containing protein [Actinomadura sp. 7K507]